MLMTLLETLGARVGPPQLRKRIHDVYWNDAERPWRRSAFWLVLRVRIQRILCIKSSAESGRVPL